MKTKLGLFSLIALVTGNMIGSGIFLLPASLASIGSISLFSWVLTSVGAIALALIFAHLSLQQPKLGGPYAYVEAGLGSFFGVQTAYLYWFSIWAGNAAMALALVGYASVFFPILNQPIYAAVTAIVIIWLITLMNIRGVGVVGRFSLITTIIKVATILAIALLGWRYFNFQHYSEAFNVTSPHKSNFMAITMAASLTLWSFLGLESATVPADSVQDPKRTIPRATIIGTLLAALIYILSSAVIMGMLPVHVLQHDNAPFATAAQLIFGAWGWVIVAIGAIISCLGCLNGWVLLQGQVAMAAAQDGLFPRIFARCNGAQVPVYGLLITSALITVMLLLTLSKSLTQQFETMILLAVIASLIPYLYTAIAHIKITKRIIWLFVTLIALLYSLWAVVGAVQGLF